MANKRVDTTPGRRPSKGVVKNSKGGSSSTKAFLIVVALIVVAGVGSLGYMASKGGPGAISSPIDSTLPPVQSEGYVIGSATAPVEVIEFGDFECPVCATFSALTEPDVRTQLVNTGRIRFRYIDFPLPIHANTWDASRAAACADEQGKFWEMHDALYANQDRWAQQATRSPAGVIKGLGRQIQGLDAGKFEECVDSNRMQAKIQAHNAIASRYNVNSTPTFMIGGRMYPGVQSYDQLKALVDQAIAAGDTARKALGTP